MPFKHEDKKAGDVLKSADWNAGMQEVLRLDKDKVDRKGDTITGSLSIGDALNVVGNTTIGTTTVVGNRAALTLRGRVAAEPAATLTLQNIAGGAGAGGTLDFNGYDVGNNAPTARIRSLDDGNYSSHLGFYTKQSGAATNLLQERVRIQSNGHVGVGTNTPIARLDIQSVPRSGTHPTTVKGLYVTGDFGPDSDGVEFRHSNGSQGLGFGHNTIYATGSNPNQDLGLKPRGTGKVNITTSLTVGGSLDFGATTRQMINLWNSNYGIGIQSGTQYFRTDKNFAWYKAGSHDNGELNAGVNGSAQMVINDGKVGIGTSSPAERLDVTGNIKASGTLYAGGKPVAYENYEIYLRGSAFESSEGNITFLKIANISMDLTTGRGLNTAILNPNGTYKNKATHDVHGDVVNWNIWADWVNANSANGDVIAVASFDALYNAPQTGSAGQLLRLVGAVEAFRVQKGGQFRVSYALLFIRGQAGAVEVAQPYQGSNAHIRTTYYSLLNAANSVITGMIVMWSGDETSIPGGWALCDGQAGRPDLRSRFVLGSGQGSGLTNRTKGAIGGVERYALTVAEMPIHNHGITDPGHAHTWTATRQEAGVDDRNNTQELSKGDAGTPDTLSKTTNSVATGISIQNSGSSQSHENMPPFYVLAFIIKL